MLWWEWGFWTCTFTIFYIYVGYPIVLFCLGRCGENGIKKADFEPTVTILIAAYNEEACIRTTLQNKLELSYPKEKLQIIVISDGSTDGTDRVVREFERDGVELIRQESRAGKTVALNLAVPSARGEILVFSDANSMYGADALFHLMRNFNDPDVGYVTGKMIYTNVDGTTAGDGCSSYMKYENILRQYETKIGSVVGVDGGIDAVRKSLYQPMRPDQIPDFVLPLKVIEQGFRVIYEPFALLREQVLKSSGDEYKMRVRVSLRSLWAIKDMSILLNVFRYGVFSIQLFSHKVLRYLAFIFILSLYFLNILLLSEGLLYQVIFTVQNLFYIASYLGYRSNQAGKADPILNLPYYFVLINLAAGHAVVKFLSGTKQVIWNPRTG